MLMVILWKAKVSAAGKQPTVSISDLVIKLHS